MAKRRPANRQAQQRDRVERERRELRARAAADPPAEPVAEIRNLPDPAAQARQSAAFAALRSDQDRAAELFNSPFRTTETGRSSSARPNSEQIATRGRPIRSVQDAAADALAMACDGVELTDIVRHRAARAHRYHLPDTHRILLEHTTTHSVEISVTTQLTLGNARPPGPTDRYPLIQTTANAADLVRAYGPQAAMLFKTCLDVNGVVQVQILNTYQFRLWKGHAFCWKEIMPRVVRNLHNAWIENYAGAIPEIKKGGRMLDAGDQYDPLEFIKPAEPDRELRRFDLPSSS